MTNYFSYFLVLSTLSLLFTCLFKTQPTFKSTLNLLNSPSSTYSTFKKGTNFYFSHFNTASKKLIQFIY